MFDGMAHMMDSFLTSQENLLMDVYWCATMKEFVDIGPEVIRC
jgi:histidinol phosphatase-like enzyme